MSRPSRATDFDEVGPDGDADPSPLRRLILAQEAEPGGAAVALLTTSTLTSEPLDLDDYVRQSALGERLLGTALPELDVPDAELPPGLVRAPVVAVNYHEIPRGNHRAVEERLRRLRDLGEVFDPDDEAPDGPRVVVGFYDGYREAGLFGAEVCDRLGLRACFFPIFEQHDEPGAAELRDDELADLARVHELGFHTASHARCADVAETDLQHEVHDVLDRLTALGGRPPRLGAWRGGTRFDPTLLGDRALRERGVRFVVSNWSIEAVPRAE